MSLILNIDTAQEIAQISVAQNGHVLGGASNDEQREHAAFVQPAIQSLMTRLGLAMGDLNAVALSIGPGSYTGLRVGMASAKGICYTLKIPLIGVGTLELMAHAAQLDSPDFDQWCPMIDARRQEVYTAVYDRDLRPVLPPQAMILDTESFGDFIKNQRILFFGSGSFKWEKIIPQAHYQKGCIFKKILITNFSLANLSNRYFIQEQFINLAYAEPFYLKEFHNSSANLKTQ